jgi:hypothetical protein
VCVGSGHAVEDEGAEVAGTAGWRIRVDECPEGVQLMP